MINNPQLFVYKASAGSGKTFTLAVEYIKLLVANPTEYRNILAVTFTNKATAEMKERILSQLYGIWTGDKEAQAYLNKIKEETSIGDGEIRKRAGEALNLMIHDYSRFRVETIDSFFQSVMRNMARELELGANLNIELENKSVLSDAVDSMMEKLDRHSPVLYWLLDYIEEKISDDKRWKIDKEIKDFGLHIFNETFIEKGESLRKKLEDKDFISKYRKELTDILNEAESQMKGFPEQFFGLLEVNGLSDDDLKSGKKGISSYFRKLSEGKFGDDIVTVTVTKSLADSNEWVTKTNKRKDEIISLVESELRPLLIEAEKFRKKNAMIINSCNLSLKYANNVRLLSYIDKEVREDNLKNNRFLLSDTNALLHNLVNKDDPSFVFEKLGTNIRHVMIDEFQDTSRMQWGNFRLLLLEGLSQGFDSLIVGDVKQSIYRWRSGDWGILNSLKNHIDTFPITLKNLETNRRSSGNIIAFNNALFTEACSQLNQQYMEETGSECKQIMDAYEDVRQLSANNPDKGYVKMTFLSKKDDVTYEDNTLSELAIQVQELISSGINQEEIAILIRKNRNIPIIADYFDKNTPYRIISDEAFRLDASLAVSLIIDAIEYLVDPDNSVAKAQLALSYQHDILKKEIAPNTILFSNIDDYLPNEFTSQQNSLSMMPLYELIENIYFLFSLEKIEKQSAYLCSFFDSVINYLQDNSSDLTSFLTYWEEKLSSKTIPSGDMDGIRILSIHKSKGLEFHTVLIPFCDWKMENETNSNVIWCAPKEKPFDNLDLVPINYSSTMGQSIYKDDYIEEKVQLWIDNLNILYVAFTRAKNNLIIWGNSERKGTISYLLSDIMDNIAERKDKMLSIKVSEEEKEEESTDKIFEINELFIPAKKESMLTTNRLLEIPKQISLNLESMDTKIDFQQSNKSAEFIDGNEEGFIQRGQLLHKLFSCIDTKEDIPKAIERMRFEGVIESTEEEEKIKKFTLWAMKNPMVDEWYSPVWKLYNECTIIYKENGETKTKRPDRVMMRNDETIVVDFKFASPKETYDQQVKDYMDLLKRMGYSNVKGYLWYVYKNEIKEINY